MRLAQCMMHAGSHFHLLRHITSSSVNQWRDFSLLGSVCVCGRAALLCDPPCWSIATCMCVCVKAPLVGCFPHLR